MSSISDKIRDILLISEDDILVDVVDEHTVMVSIYDPEGLLEQEDSLYREAIERQLRPYSCLWDVLDNYEIAIKITC